MFKIKKVKKVIEEMKGVQVGMIVQIYDHIYEITAIKAEAWGTNNYTFIACGVDKKTEEELTLFQIDNFYEHVMDKVIKVLDDDKVQSEQISG